MDVSEEYADTAAERVQKLWETCDLEHSGYNAIYYYIGERGEYPRMILSKMSNTLVEQGWTITAIQYLDAYGVEFSKAMDEDIYKQHV